MTWRCAECGRSESKKIKVDGVCHHCGKTLCRVHQRAHRDHAFHGLLVEALHCRPCLKEHHGSSASLNSEPDQ